MKMIPEWIACVAMVGAFAYGFLIGRGFALDGNSAFWTGFVDGLTMRRLWKR